MTRSVSIAGVDLDIAEKGTGRPLLFLHGVEGLRAELPWFDALAESYRVIAPSHPGFGRSSLPDFIGTIEDLAYLYLDLADKLALENAVLVGNSLGGWIAAEMAVRTTNRFGHIVLADPLGIKVGGVNTRDIADMHAMTRQDFLRAAWSSPKAAEQDYTQMPDTDLAAIARGREAVALFGWKPYMHNPRLKRWLHRIDKPTLLLWGADDGIVTPKYGEGFTGEIANAKLEIIPKAGHFPQWEQPADFCAKVRAFAGR